MFPSEITVASLEFKQIFEFPDIANGDTKPKGSEGRLLEVLSQALKFNYKLVTSADKQWGQQTENGTWSGLIGVVMRGEADMALCLIGTNEERKKVIDFSESYFLSGLTFATNFPDALPTAYAYIYPFDLITWLSIAVILFTLPLIFRMLKITKMPYTYILLKVFGAIISQPLNDKKFNGLLLLSFFWYFAFWISAGYEAVLASFLSVPLHETYIKDFKHLAKAVQRGEYKLLAPKGTLHVTEMIKTGKDNLIYIANIIEKNDWNVLSNKYLDEDNFDGKIAVIGIRNDLNLRFGKEPFARKFISDETAYVLHAAVAVNKNFCCKNKLDETIKRINGAGFLTLFINDELYKSWFRSKKEDLDQIGYHPLSLNDISGSFILLGIGYGLSVITFLGEIFYFYYCKRLKTYK